MSSCFLLKWFVIVTAVAAPTLSLRATDRTTISLNGTGHHELEFIETRRHWFNSVVEHDASAGVNVLNLVDGEEAIVESPSATFEPFHVHYAETFIVPAQAGRYSIRSADGHRCATIRAAARTEG